MTDTETLRRAIRDLHGCDARWLESVQVDERFGVEAVWTGRVEVFQLIGHATARRAYSWRFETDAGKPRVVAVLGVPPINSAADAVRAAIASGQQT
jgi:hypothetical protein